MSDISPEHLNDPAPETETSQIETPDTPMPEGLPQKFWDDTVKTVRLEAMIKSYGELERKLGAEGAPDIPDTADEYDIATDNLALDSDPEINARLHQAGFSTEQARLVYQLANEKLQPMLAGLAEDYESRAQIDQLETHFGGAEKWREVSRQLQTWGQANLAGEVYGVLSATRDGVLALHRMMETGEPGIGPSAGHGSAAPDRSVKELMNDPRYWRDHDPAVVEKVRQGFKALYPEG